MRYQKKTGLWNSVTVYNCWNKNNSHLAKDGGFQQLQYTSEHSVL